MNKHLISSILLVLLVAIAVAGHTNDVAIPMTSSTVK